ncbi:MAG: hypothetical protein DI533_22480 [Cereibacter sphaeroides]|uniref:Uncharacterized protein n=1 Tax=Cereibacter sphaeroides TaxID=1063 RepID=A0A2W5RZQ7_CERSP|nr:MAG: hypothetical protein DI533_22480 [Cereibacter sphaeroides]
MDPDFRQDDGGGEAVSTKNGPPTLLMFMPEAAIHSNFLKRARPAANALEVMHPTERTHLHHAASAILATASTVCLFFAERLEECSIQRQENFIARWRITSIEIGKKCIKF